MAAAAPAFGFAHLAQKPLPPLEPGAWALTRAAAEAWLARARPGEQLVYARGPRLLQSDGVKALQDRFDEGEVTFTTRRIAADDIAYIAERLAGGSRPAPHQRFARTAPPPDDADEIAMLMATLRRLAAARRPCPTNRELGEMVGDIGPDRVAYLLRKLISARRIAVEALGNGRRVVTIIATGKRTATC